MRPAVGRAMVDAAPTVMLVAENGGSGGIGRYCVDLAELLGPRAVVACLCPAPGSGCGSCWLSRRCVERQVPLLSVPMPAKDVRRGVAGLRTLWILLGRPVVHVHGRRGNLAATLISVAERRFAFVTTVHGMLGLHNRRNFAYRLVDLVSCRHASSVIAVSADTRRRLVQAGVAHRKVVHIPNGLSEGELRALTAVAAARGSQGSGRKVSAPLRFGYVGRLSREKGIEEYSRIALRVLGEGAPAEFVVAGDGPLREAFLRAASEHLDSGAVCYLGETEETVGVMSDIDVLVMASRNEGMPYALLEAMAAGCPTASFGVGGIPEVVTDSTLGLLARPGESEALERVVLDLAYGRHDVVGMGGAASLHISRKYALSTRAPEFDGVYAATGATPETGLDLDRAERLFLRCA